MSTFIYRDIQPQANLYLGTVEFKQSVPVHEKNLDTSLEDSASSCHHCRLNHGRRPLRHCTFNIKIKLIKLAENTPVFISNRAHEQNKWFQYLFHETNSYIFGSYSRKFTPPQKKFPTGTSSYCQKRNISWVYLHYHSIARKFISGTQAIWWEY